MRDGTGSTAATNKRSREGPNVTYVRLLSLPLELLLHVVKYLITANPNSVLHLMHASQALYGRLTSQAFSLLGRQYTARVLGWSSFDSMERYLGHVADSRLCESSQYPTATLLDGKVDRQSREHIIRLSWWKLLTLRKQLCQFCCSNLNDKSSPTLDTASDLSTEGTHTQSLTRFLGGWWGFTSTCPCCTATLGNPTDVVVCGTCRSRFCWTCVEDCSKVKHCCSCPESWEKFCPRCWSVVFPKCLQCGVRGCSFCETDIDPRAPYTCSECQGL
ncbi:hypothetical protein DFS34DRAFT_610904 [Phlyctochytrium arcticum]|nr:hypothetical protein DFS34DRAFT_610904 [Phlyctochytrium arcticum]